MLELEGTKWIVWVGAGALAVSLLALVGLYRCRREDEPLLGPKLLGCLALGAFSIAAGDFRFPLGFAAFALLFFRLKRIRRAKLGAAVLGLCLLMLYGISPSIENRLFERDRSIAMTDTRMGRFDFESHWGDVTAAFAVSGDARLEKFEMSYEANGKLLTLAHEWLDRRPEGGFVYYRARLDPDDAEVVVSRSRLDGPWMQYDRSVPMSRFARMLHEADWSRLRPAGGPAPYYYYSLKADGSSVNYAIKDASKFAVSGDKLQPIDNASLPVQGYWILACGALTAQGPSSVGCDAWADFLFDSSFGNP
ncbi:hypothetical protein [Paenibacillus flagellatus]|uniref:Uncharacterized protein n=1 Tax=Paenibacillus flagellatus TaxID=2211139 RepID=A0A2V5K5J0_9BACL|nr:hypothetical protein [Paenibacillus flagellatus]PYI52953.1 hypothetical protein DLM86_18310 [Paenibacillus flagellatus]